MNNVLVETDIPHPTCLYPVAREHFARVLARSTRDVAERVLQDNAAELYRSTSASRAMAAPCDRDVSTRRARALSGEPAPRAAVMPTSTPTSVRSIRGY